MLEYKRLQNLYLWVGLSAAIAVSVGAISRNRNTSALPAAGAAEKSAPLPAAQNADIETAGLTSTPITLDVTGSVRPELESALASKVIARVDHVDVRAGDPVRRGQRLIVLDSRDLDASMAQANANLRVANAGYDGARVAAKMEEEMTSIRISEARSKIAQGEAALQAARARLQLVQAGPRQQEREQAQLAVTQARSNLNLAASNLKRMKELYQEGAVSAQQYDQYRVQNEVAQSQYESALQGKSLSDEGSRVEEIRVAQQAVRQAEAGLDEARVGLQSAQASALQIDVRKQEVLGAKAQIGQSRAGLTIAKVTKDYTVLSSPFDGVVTRRTADPGTMAGPGTTLLTVQGGALRLEAVVPESAIKAVRIGGSVPVQFDSLGNKRLSGQVVEILPQGDPASHTFIVKIELPSASGASAGMFGRARFGIGIESRMMVPVSALIEREGLRYMYVVDTSNIAHMRMVTVGDPIDKSITVLSGLNAGERFVSSGVDKISDGAPISGGAR